MSQTSLRIAIGADHGAFALKQALAEHLRTAGYDVTDFGTDSADSMDYPDVANPVAQAVAYGSYDFAILACTTGVGMSIAANRHHHVRAANARSVEEAVTIRDHNNTNILCLGAKFTDEATAIAIVDTFLTTPFAGGRHTARVEKIAALDATAHSSSGS